MVTNVLENFIISDEWIENFRLSKETFTDLYGQRRPVLTNPGTKREKQLLLKVQAQNKIAM